MTDNSTVSIHCIAMRNGARQHYATTIVWPTCNPCTSVHLGDGPNCARQITATISQLPDHVAWLFNTSACADNTQHSSVSHVASAQSAPGHDNDLKTISAQGNPRLSGKIQHTDNGMRCGSHMYVQPHALLALNHWQPLVRHHHLSRVVERSVLWLKQLAVAAASGDDSCCSTGTSTVHNRFHCNAIPRVQRHRAQMYTEHK